LIPLSEPQFTVCFFSHSLVSLLFPATFVCPSFDVSCIKLEGPGSLDPSAPHTWSLCPRFKTNCAPLNSFPPVLLAPFLCFLFSSSLSTGMDLVLPITFWSIGHLFLQCAIWVPLCLPPFFCVPFVFSKPVLISLYERPLSCVLSPSPGNPLDGVGLVCFAFPPHSPVWFLPSLTFSLFVLLLHCPLCPSRSKFPFACRRSRVLEPALSSACFFFSYCLAFFLPVCLGSPSLCFFSDFGCSF